MISIIGVGRVGSAVGFLIASESLDDLVLINHNKYKAIGEALDLTNAVPKGSSISITGTDDYELMKGSKVVVIAASGGKMGASRTDLLAYNVPLIKEIASKIKKYGDSSKVVVVTNPLDVVTYFALMETSFSRESVIGMGSSLDSSRFRYLIAKELQTSQKEIEGTVVGEHGDSMVPLFSSAKVAGKPILNMISRKQMSEITAEVKDYWRYLKKFKEASVFGAAKNTFDIVNAIIRNEKLDVSASILLDGEYDLSDVCLGVPVTIRKNGVAKIHEIDMEDSELQSLHESARTIQNNISIAQKSR